MKKEECDAIEGPEELSKISLKLAEHDEHEEGEDEHEGQVQPPTEASEQGATQYTAEPEWTRANSVPGELFVKYVATWDIVKAATDEILAPLSGEIEKARDFPNVVEQTVVLYQKALKIAETALREHLALRMEIEKRLRTNWINYNFGALLIAHLGGDIQFQTRAYRNLLQTFQGKLYKMGWFRPGGEPWTGPIDEALVEQCNRFSSLDPLDIFLKILGDEFAYIYKAVLNRCTDQLRKDIRQTDEVPYDQDFFKQLQAAPLDPDARMQAEALIELLRARRGGAPPYLADCLGALETWLAKRDEMSAMTVSQQAEWFVKEVAFVRGISPQWAGNERRRFEKEAQQGLDEISEIHHALEALVPKERISVRVHQVEEHEDFGE